MDKQFPAHQELHHVLQHRLMRELVKRFQREYTVIDFFIVGVPVGACCGPDGSASDRIRGCINPAGSFQDCRNLAQKTLDLIGRKKIPDKGISVASHFLPQGEGADVPMRYRAKWPQRVDLGTAFESWKDACSLDRTQIFES